MSDSCKSLGKMKLILMNLEALTVGKHYIKHFKYDYTENSDYKGAFFSFCFILDQKFVLMYQ